MRALVTKCRRIRKLSVLLCAATAGAIAAGDASARADGIPTSQPMTYAGHFQDASGMPLAGAKNVTIALWDAATAGNQTCSVGPVSVNLNAGDFSIPLPDACTNAVHTTPDLWVDVQVDGMSLGRSKLGAVPYAADAQRSVDAVGDIHPKSVGIGTTTPGTMLEVDQSSGDVALFSSTQAHADIAGLRLRTNQSDSSIGLVLDNSNSTVNKIAGIRLDGGGNLAFHAGLPSGSTLSSDASRKMFITPAGNVGVGTVNPATAFHVSSPSYPQFTIDDQQSRTFAMGVVAATFRIRDVVGPGAPGAADVLTIDQGGNVGIGTTSPAFMLHVNGSAGKPGGGSWTDSSDIRLKKNVRPLRDSLDRLLRLQGVTYEWREPEKRGNLQGDQIGMIAQDVEKVFPQWVGTDPEGYRTLTFRGFEALSVESFRSLKAENDALYAKVALLENRLKRLEDGPPNLARTIDPRWGWPLGALGLAAFVAWRRPRGRRDST